MNLSARTSCKLIASESEPMCKEGKWCIKSENLDQPKLVNLQVHHFLGYSFNTITLDYNFVTCLDTECLREDAGISKDKLSKSFAKD